MKFAYWSLLNSFESIPKKSSERGLSTIIGSAEKSLKQKRETFELVQQVATFKRKDNIPYPNYIYP